MTIAILTAQDVAAYRRLMLQAYKDAADAFTSSYEERAAESESWWIARIGGPSEASITFGAFDDDELLGSSALRFSSGAKIRHRAFLFGMFVVPTSRGSGIGRALVEHALQHAREREGVRSAWLTVTEGNSPAIRLYESFGFQVTGTEPMAILTPTGYKGMVHMWKDLSSPP